MQHRYEPPRALVYRPPAWPFLAGLGVWAVIIAVIVAVF